MTIHLFLQGQTFASEEIILRVIVNTAKKGDFVVLLTPERDILMGVEDFRKLGIKDPGKYIEIEGKRYVSLRSLHPDLSFVLNEKEVTLEIKAAPDLLEETILDLYSRPSKTPYARHNSAFLNYVVSYSSGADFDLDTLSLSPEIGLRVTDYLGLGTFSFVKTKEERRSVRLNSSIIRDDSEALRRIIIGDFTGLSGPLGSSFLMGGLSVSKNFAIDPYFLKFATPGLQGTVETPSEVEIFRNGRVVTRKRLPPGNFLLQNIPGVVSGLGDLNVVIRDAFGREKVITRPYYVAETLLKERTHEYSYNVGLTREAFGTESFRYDEPVFLAFHNVGLSDRLNGGLTAEASKELINFGPTAAFLINRAGVLNLAAAFSNTKGKNGLGGLLNHSFRSRRFSTSFSLSALSREYSNLSLVSTKDRTKFEAIFALGLSLGKLGSITGEVSVLRRHIGLDRDRVFLSSNWPITKNVSLFLTASSTREIETSNRVFAGLHINLGRGVSALLSHNTRDGENRESLGVQKSAPESGGFGFRASVERVPPDEGKASTDANAFLQYNGPYGNYTGEYQRSDEIQRSSFSISGGLAVIGGSFLFTRPINDSFALVRASGLEGVGVKFNNRKVGSTNAKGEILVPNLLSFQNNRIDIENRDIPLNYSIESVTKFVTPPFRGGSLVDFKLQKIQGISGTISYFEKGKKEAIEYGRLGLKVKNKIIESPIGKDGEFYLENIPPGRYEGRVFFKSKECGVEIIIPKRDEVLIDLGSVTCEDVS